MHPELASKLKNWKFCRSLAMDILKMLADEQLNFTVGKNMGTLGEQFRHMARVQLQYTEALETKKIARTKQTIDSSIAKSRDRLIDLWEEIDERMLGTINNMNDDEMESAKIDWTYWGSEPMNLYDHLQALIDHAYLHNGQIVVYIRTLELKFPESWKAWEL
jgi:uncharacterized damage-inducible protein DinB